MGISASSLLDENKSNHVKGQAEAELKDFSPYFKGQYSAARFAQVEEDLEPNKEKITQLLKQKEAPEEAEVLYEEGVLFFDETRKWRERYVVVRANYCLECHDGLETFLKGVPPRQKLLPTGGTVFTAEEKYMAAVDKCFPDDSSMKEDFAPPLSGMPAQFPVYLRLPYRRDSYFCFRQQSKQDAFLSILSDCIRHQNQDFLKKKTCEVQAFLRAIQLYRQDLGHYEAWDMLIGSDVRVMGNLVMERLLPSLEKDMLPGLKAKKAEKKRVWFATVEAAYILIQEHLLEGLSKLKDDCRTAGRQQEVLMHSDMDQIVETMRQLEEKVRAKVWEPAEKLCSESVQPYLGSVLEELMEPLSSGFQEGRRLIEALMDEVCQDVLRGDNDQVKKTLAGMAKPNLTSCYQKIAALQEKLQLLQERFSFSNITGVIHSAQIDLQQLMKNAAYTFEQLLYKAVQDNPDNAASAIEKVKHRVLKQYDYDSSTVRKRISREALVSITLPFIKKNLAPACKTELQSLQESINDDHAHFVHVENVYENVLLQTLDKEVSKVVKEAASLSKYNLFTDSRDLLSQSSRSSLSSPPVSTPNSPAISLAFPAKTSLELQPPSLPTVNGLSTAQTEEEPQQQVNGALQAEAEVMVHEVEDAVQTVQTESGAPPPAAADTKALIETQEVAAAPEIEQEVVCVQSEQEEPRPQDSDTAPGPDPAPEDAAVVSNGGPADTVEEKTLSSGIEPGAPSSGQTPAVADLKADEAAEPATESDLKPPVQSPPPPDIEMRKEVEETQSSREEKSTTSDVLEDEANLCKSPVTSDDPGEERTVSEEPAAEAVSGDVEATPNVEPLLEAVEAPATEPIQQETPSGTDVPSQEAPPPDSIKEIRDLVVEVIEVEELLQRYPSGVPTDN